MKRRLRLHARSISRLMHCVSSLRSDLQFEQNGGHIIHAVDFSEVFAFLEANSPEQTEVGLHVGHPEHQFFQQTLALRHLFLTFSNRVYVLPPHVEELLSYVRVEQRTIETGRALRSQVLRWSDQVDPRYGTLLRKVSRGAVLSEGEKSELIELVKSDFDGVCQRVSDFMNRYYQRRGRLGKLHDLIRRRRLDYEFDREFLKYVEERPKLSAVTGQEEATILAQLISSSKTELNRFAKMRDVRALLYLRDAGNLLAGANSKLVLYSRDKLLSRVAYYLEQGGNASSHWTGIRDRLRSLENILLDLILQGGQSGREKLDWLSETEQILSSMKRSVDLILADDSQSGYLLRAGTQLIENAWETWNQHLNIRLSLAKPLDSWKIQFPAREPNSVAAAEVRTSGGAEVLVRDEVQLIELLIEFISSGEYRKVATSSVDNLWRELTMESRIIEFIGHLDKRTEVAIGLIARTFRSHGQQKTVLTSGREWRFYSIQFISDTYQRVHNSIFGSPDDDANRLSSIQDRFLAVALKRSKEGPAAEDFLFMAFILLSLGHWAEAGNLATESLCAGHGEMRKSEAKYLLAVAHRNIAAHEIPVKLGEYEIAYGFIQEAISEKKRERQTGGSDLDGREGGEDPRYLKEKATIILLYCEALEKLPIQPDQSPHFFDRSIADASAAIQMLTRALHLATGDVRLRVEIMNNLAFVGVQHETASDDDVKNAEEYIRKIDNEFQSDKSNLRRLLPEQPWLFLRDTQIMVRVARARLSGDVSELERCEQSLLSMISEIPELTPGDQAQLDGHLISIRQLRSSLS